MHPYLGRMLACLGLKSTYHGPKAGSLGPKGESRGTKLRNHGIKPRGVRCTNRIPREPGR